MTTLGKTGLRLNRLALAIGPYEDAVDTERFEQLIGTYTEAGGATFDISGDDAGFAQQAFADAFTAHQLAREDVVLIGRSGRRRAAQALSGAVGDTSRRGLMTNLDATLNAIGTEHLDVWLIDGLDDVTPAAEVAAAMHWALESGRATYVGLARCAAWQAVDIAHRLAEHRDSLAAHAVTYNLLERDAEQDVRTAATAFGYGIIGAMPLAAGVLSGKYRHGTPSDSRLTSAQAVTVRRYLKQHNRPVIESLATAADGLGVHPSELALAWALQGGIADVLSLGARTPAQLKVCLRAFDLNVPNEIIAVLDEVSRR